MFIHKGVTSMDLFILKGVSDELVEVLVARYGTILAEYGTVVLPVGVATYKELKDLGLDVTVRTV
ncbi:hypothetical protein ZHX_gp45 [Edwardsiella phage vB_EpP_ZHX]|uniref:Uncharacterized protein n=3 Tax=Kafunavirus KF1 TaxID=1982588 RepID=K4PXB9_9CAUD|nr:hypothetical protein D877_gp04 [Edwardsiella phage KF-1]UIS54061.1 hypothetical protein ZHX_gp1 [Edwardsiella phage vB_EpP_ZHX]UIS54105.1 hypothetical protein ZHX_gp45 [Edwardsiella phage vB_EpP_ZHX]BAM63052.1 hypothetical protein [Edwardsiella phage KF-1]